MVSQIIDLSHNPPLFTESDSFQGTTYSFIVGGPAAYADRPLAQPHDYPWISVTIVSTVYFTN